MNSFEIASYFGFRSASNKGLVGHRQSIFGGVVSSNLFLQFDILVPNTAFLGAMHDSTSTFFMLSNWNEKVLVNRSDVFNMLIHEEH